MTITHNTLILLTWVMVTLSAIGTSVTVGMLLKVSRRKRLISRSAPGDLVAQITVKRTVRQESAFLICQGSILAVSIYNLVGSLPDIPVGEAESYVSSFAARSVVVLSLLYTSIRDLRDREALVRELDRRDVLLSGKKQ